MKQFCGGREGTTSSRASRILIGPYRHGCKSRALPDSRLRIPHPNLPSLSSFCNIELMRLPSRFLLVLGLLIASALAQAPAAKPKAAPNANPQGCGRLTDNVLKCPRFGFTYKVAFGWVDRTDDMQPDDDDDKQESGDTAQLEACATSKSETLLAVFERPPGAPGHSINSPVVICAVCLSKYHGFRTASDYFGPISE